MDRKTLWIGGSPCAGKSSIADAIARDHGYAVYRCDDAIERHNGLTSPERQPLMRWMSRLTCDELWLRPVEEQVNEEIMYYHEEHAFILDDLAGLSGKVIAEGAALLPELIDPAIVAARRAIWIVPSAEFQLEHYGRRDWTAGTLADCTDRATAWANWMERDVRFARHVKETAEERGYPVLVVDGSTSLEENIAFVASMLNG